MNNTASNPSPVSFRIVARAPGAPEVWTDRNTATVYRFAVWVQSEVKGYEGEWIFCGFASTDKRAAALARKEGGVIVQTEVTAL
jgi:hypothetical protein